ncbi:MAG: Peptidase M48 [Lasallia pustulata]|uniref:Peptidase M48 n=1 Tax=Lasallia pustulata TaxID=136370 RepID=A0A5M8PQK8_9LECA|nr:MAG: Peptidase M48 [Lasallia pustulata]
MRPFPRPSILRRLPLRPFSLRCPPSPTHIARRPQSGFQYRGGQQRPQYHRFGRAKQLQYLWYNSPTFRYGAGAVGVGALGFVGYNLERVPVTNRLRFNCVSHEYEVSMAQQMYAEILKEYGRQILPAWHPDSKLVHKVLNRLIPASGLQDQRWEVHVINDDSQKNAFVIPGGKVFVFSGILPICTTESGLAAVLAHEIAHTIAHHPAERLSQSFLILPAALALSYLFDVSGQLASAALEYAYMRPGSRAQESEADHIGLLMMARVCYDPRAAVGLWQRMEEEEKASGVAVPQFLSTHPSSRNRIGLIRGWLAQAEEVGRESGCAGVGGDGELASGEVLGSGMC